ncbi:hypothetical protein [Thermobifida cellulosilytica]|uniref:Uncharacterized protein n=1 Tax=Thermobifida cellulosilytica TB100 TaxID=665004 RepID=A0A147KKZ6_THECS|nr:hypothetical protein [Thermobifida cellulosilytica]KUP97974.1 hypothetical protein AC529_04150 [Thermobifida cellulosilytica TB100]
MSDKDEGTGEGGGDQPVRFVESSEAVEGDLLTSVDVEESLDGLLEGETEEHAAPEAVLRAFELYQEKQLG